MKSAEGRLYESEYAERQRTTWCVPVSLCIKEEIGRKCTQAAGVAGGCTRETKRRWK